MNLTLIVDYQPRDNPSPNLRSYTINIGSALRSLGDVYDELKIVYQEGVIDAKITRRCILSEYGVLSLLNPPVEEKIEVDDIELFEGINYVYIKEFNNLPIYISYLKNNELNKMHPTYIEMKTTIQQTMDSILLQVFQKTEAEELITYLNLLAGKAKLKAAIIEFEGMITANGNSKIKEDGTAEFVNVKITGGNIYLDSGGKVLGGDGVLTNLFFQSDGQFENFSPLGFRFNSASQRISYADVSLDFDIPSKFKIESAILTVYHTPAYWNAFDEENGTNYDVWGYARNLQLYKADNETVNYQFNMTFGSEYETSISSSDVSLIPNAFGSSGYTPSNKSGATLERKNSIDIKDYLISGKRNKLIVRTGNSIPATLKDAYPQIGMSRAVLNIIGYLSN